VNLEAWTVNIPVPHLDDLPLRTQMHAVVVGGTFSCLLQKVARAVMCYHEHRDPHDD